MSTPASRKAKEREDALAFLREIHAAGDILSRIQKTLKAGPRNSSKGQPLR